MKFFTVLTLAVLLVACVSAKNYTIITTSLNWHLAFQDCEYRGMQLATIESEEELNAVDAASKAAGTANEAMWTAGTDLAEEAKFVWMNTGKGFTYVRWAANQPDNWKDNEHCMHLRRDGGQLVFNDVDCPRKMYYICEDKPINCDE